eukprot:5795596-Heterocapsa_arctica.AAC.1
MRLLECGGRRQYRTDLIKCEQTVKECARPSRQQASYVATEDNTESTEIRQTAGHRVSQTETN